MREEIDALLVARFIGAGLDRSRQHDSAAHVSRMDRDACAAVREAALALLATLIGAPTGSGQPLLGNPLDGRHHLKSLPRDFGMGPVLATRPNRKDTKSVARKLIPGLRSAAHGTILML